MKILLDENLPHQLRLEIREHDVFTVAFMGWSGVDNGELLQRAIAADFAVFISNDRGLEYEQSLSGLAIAVVVLLPTKIQSKQFDHYCQC
jgi:predicted nuclease of predicted toxin-antitoxin system